MMSTKSHFVFVNMVNIEGASNPNTMKDAGEGGGDALRVVWVEHAEPWSSQPCCCLSPVLQDRLSQQQRDMEEERSRLQEVIAKMEARLSEQTRLLEQVSAQPVLCLGRPSGYGEDNISPLEIPDSELVNGICFSSVPGPGAMEGDGRAIQSGVSAALSRGAAASHEPAALHGEGRTGEGKGELGWASPRVFHIS